MCRLICKICKKKINMFFVPQTIILELIYNTALKVLFTLAVLNNS